MVAGQAGSLEVAGLRSACEQPRRPVDQDAPARVLVRRPVVKQIEQMAVVGASFRWQSRDAASRCPSDPFAMRYLAVAK
jgi:hypothetical protein